MDLLTFQYNLAYLHTNKVIYCVFSFFSLFHIAVFLIIPMLKQEIKEKTELIIPVYSFFLTCEKIFTPLNIVKKKVKVLFV